MCYRLQPMGWNINGWKGLNTATQVATLLGVPLAIAALVVGGLALRDNTRAQLIVAPATSFTLRDVPPSALVQIQIKNVGTATAENVTRANALTLLLPFTGTERDRQPDWAGVLLPDLWQPGDVYDKGGHRIDIAHSGSGLPLAPTDHREMSLDTQDSVGPLPFDPGDLFRLRTNRVVLVAFVRFTYTDHSGQPRVTRACRYWNPPQGGVADCPRWNSQ